MNDIDLTEIQSYILQPGKEYRKNILLYLKWVLEKYENRQETHSKTICENFKIAHAMYAEGVKTLKEWNRINQDKDHNYLVDHKSTEKSGWTVKTRLSHDELQLFLKEMDEYIPAKMQIWTYDMPDENDYLMAIKVYDENLCASPKKNFLKIGNITYPLKCLSLYAIGIKNGLDGPANVHMITTTECKGNIRKKNMPFEIIESDKKPRNASLDQSEPKMLKEQPLNQILYGPPGTGKTYHTIDKALEIIFQQNTYCGRKSEDPSQEFDIKQRKKNSDCEFEIVKKSYQQALNDNDRNALKQIFDYYKDQGQIVFTTFHQSYGYEEFVEGIKPCDLDSCESGNTEIKYAINNGIFKQLCIDAQEIKATTTLENFDWNQNNIFKMSLGGKYDSGILEWCLDNGYISMGWGGNYDFSLNDVTSWEQYRDKFKEKIRDIVEEKDIKFTLQAMYAFQQWMKVNDLVFVSYGNKKIVAIGQIIGNYEYIDNSDINYFQFRKVKWLMIDRNGIQADRLLSRGLSQQTIYNINKDNIEKDFFDSLFDKSENLTKKNYVLIIDEINRGNISKIFGELITLIEDSKRIGKSEEIRVKLPYSGYDFGVPDNLYIIGTMNTADRSIALMDTALRRRFHFEEMMPDLTTLSEKDTTLSKEASEKSEPSTNDLKVDNINIRLMLKKINERIEYLYDRDHQIGHAYFMSLKDITDEERKKAELDNIFRNKIIPLLQEYFYDDWEKIQMVLGDHKNQNANQEHKFIQNTSTKEEDLFGFNHDDIEDEKTTFTINKPFSVSAYTKIYASNSNASKIDND